MDKLACMRAFAGVVEAGGFSAAGREMKLSKALVSKYVAHLEDLLGVRLLQRTTRKVSTTSVGQSYYQRCRSLLDDLDELDLQVQENQNTPKGVLRITAPLSFAELHLMDIISEFSNEYPALEIDVSLSDRFVDIVEDGIDIALRIAELPDTALIARRLMAVRVPLCAAPAYLEEHGIPEHPSELVHHKCILEHRYDDAYRWPFVEDGQSLSLKLPSKLRVTGARAVRELALAGNGIVRCPSFVIDEDVKAGRLQVILEEFDAYRPALYAVYAHRRHLSTKVRLFIDRLAEKFSG
ncbi:MAG: LysR family transcriptional regulator [Kordiimonadaceae bacterium]|nr:LysR family transcriptional regulator [Kordiimonadaceae bacterium]